MDPYVCEECGYCYDPAYDDEHNGIEEGTPFPCLPGQWTCPECGAPKSAFHKLEDDDDEFDEDSDPEEDDGDYGWDDEY